MRKKKALSNRSPVARIDRNIHSEFKIEKEIQEGVRRIFPPRSLSIFYKLDHIVRIEVEVESVGENDV